MTLLTSLAAMPGLETLAWTLVHFLWQGALLALAAAAAMRWAAASATTRYTAGVITLAAMLAAPVATFIALDATAVPAADSALDATALGAASESAAEVLVVEAEPQSGRPATALLPALVVLWMAGVMVLSIRLLGGWMLARRVAAAAAEPASRHLEDLAARVAERLNLRRIVRLAESSTVAVPIVVGWLKPIVIVPAATLSHLAPAQVEALLAHELAHVRRHDYLVNLLQSAVETLLFYHPAVWWVSRRIRVEREHCCDDLAVTICDRVVYVRALSDLAAMTSHARLALAATDGSLLDRVRRLLAREPDDRPAAGWLTAGLVAILTAALAPAVALGSGGPQDAAATPALPAIATPAASASSGAAPEAQAAPDATQREMEAAQVVARERQQAEAATQQEQLERLAAELEALGRKREAAELAARLERDEHQRRVAVKAESLSELERQIEASRAERRTELTDATARWLEAREAELRQQLAQLQQELTPARLETTRRLLDEARARYSADHPDVRRLAALLRDLEARARAGGGAASSQAPQVVRVGGDIKPPTLIKRVEPEYPALAKAAKMQGPIYITAIIGTDGRVRDATVTGGAPFPPLQEAALAAVRQWEYAPTMLNGVPVEVELAAQVFFKLQGGDSSAATRVTDPAALIQRGDTLEIVIEGEDQLPRRYFVSAEGMIRLPLVGPVGVVDITATQARDWIRKMLTDRQLAPGRAVSVVIYRTQLQR